MIAKHDVRSGSTFTSATIQAQHKDDDRNTGMLWVDQGRDIFARDCVGCHADANTNKSLAFQLPHLS